MLAHLTPSWEEKYEKLVFYRLRILYSTSPLKVLLYVVFFMNK